MNAAWAVITVFGMLFATIIVIAGMILRVYVKTENKDSK